MKLLEIKKTADNKLFNYRDVYGVTVRKVQFKQNIFSGGKIRSSTG